MSLTHKPDVRGYAYVRNSFLVVLFIVHIPVPSPHGFMRHQKYSCSGEMFVREEHNVLNITLQTNLLYQALQKNLPQKFNS